MTNSSDSLEKIEAFLVDKQEMDSLGHRIVYDKNTGWSLNIAGAYCDPSKLDDEGFQIKL